MLRNEVASSAIMFVDDNEKEVIIPIGFYVVPGKTDISKGLVISDVVNDTEDTGNQFVWVPVDNIDTFVRDSSGSGNKEPYSYGDEYDKMRASVEKYKGFYIGRYEISLDKNNKAQSKKGVNPCIMKWGSSNSNASGGIAGKAREMYPEANAKKGNVVSTLVYGVSWDVTVRFIKINYPEIVSNSSGYGNYETVSYIPTGSNPSYALNNIYDMAGNALEFTMELYTSAGGHTMRGGYYRDSGTERPISHRLGATVTATGGGRVQLYIK